MEAHDLARRSIHLGLGATAEVELAFTNDMAWYEAYLARHSIGHERSRVVDLWLLN